MAEGNYLMAGVSSIGIIPVVGSFMGKGGKEVAQEGAQKAAKEAAEEASERAAKEKAQKEALEEAEEGAAKKTDGKKKDDDSDSGKGKKKTKDGKNESGDTEEYDAGSKAKTETGGSGDDFGGKGGEPKWKKIAKELVENNIDVSSWNKGSFETIQDSLARHYCKHGVEVGATSVEQYLRKAENFSLNLKGAKKHYVSGAVEGVVRYIKNGKYIDLAPDGTIISYGLSR